jgi:D-alanyl-D-alanine carboxypeptidase (penicillin-binding protein 5/6)
MHADSSDNRSKDTATLLSYGFNSFKNNIIYSKDTELGTVNVLKGKVDTVKVYLKEDATELLKTTEKAGEYTFNIKVDTIEAPIKKNTVVGTVEIIDNEGNIVLEKEIIVKEDIKKANFWNYLKSNLKVITSGK